MVSLSNTQSVSSTGEVIFVDTESHYKIVNYDQFCRTCKHFKDEAFTDPCNECLNTPVNIDSRKPVYWTESDASKES
jgi:hypothetical protein